MKRHLFTVKYLTLSLLSLLLSHAALAQETPWVMALEKKGISVYTRDVENSQLKAFKGKMTLQGVDISTVEDYLKNFDNLPLWLDRCNEAKVLKQHNPGHKIVYVSLAMPWPVKDRDVIGRNQIQVTEEGTQLISYIKDIQSPEFKHDVSDRVRADKLESKMTFTAEQGNTLSVTIEGHAEPGGKIPAWLANLLVTESPYKSLYNIREQLTEQTKATAAQLKDGQNPS